MERNIFAVGDIHGCLDKLRALISRLPASQDDTFVFMGDNINRGPDSRGVLDFLIRFRDEHPNTIFLMGNHEYLLLEYARTGEVEHLNALRRLGVEETLKSYGDAPVRALRDLSFMPGKHIEFLEDMTPYYREGGYLFVHAGLPRGLAPEDCGIEQMLFMRGTFLSDPWEGEETVVFGHTSFETPLVTEKKIGIDTGAVYGNALTALEIPAMRFHHA